MKILMVSCGFPPKENYGAEKFAYNLSKKLLQQNIEVAVASDVNIGKYKGIKLFKLIKINKKIPRKLYFDYYNPINRFIFRKILKKYDPDIVHFNNIYGISSNLIRLASKRKPTIVSVHDFWPICFLSTLTINNQECNKNCYKCNYPFSVITNQIKKKHLFDTTLVATSKLMYKKLVEFGYKEVIQIYNGMEIPEIDTPLNKRIIFAGRIIKEKGIELLLEELSEFEVVIEIFGDGPLLEKLKTRYKTYNKIIFHGYNDNMNDEYKKGGILVFPSLLLETLPYTLLEAMAYGLPIIATNLGSIPDIVANLETGILFNHQKQGDLLNKVKYLINNMEIQEKLRRSAYKFLKDNFDWKKIIQDYIALYERLL